LILIRTIYRIWDLGIRVNPRGRVRGNKAVGTDIHKDFELKVRKEN
jgi:hypothetical protein